MALALTAAIAAAQAPADGGISSAPLRVATRLVRPDVFEENGKTLGFSVDMAQAIANQMQPGQPQPIDIQPYSGVTEVLEAIRTGEADLALGAIALTSQREQAFDFSHPILSAGLQIMVPAADQQTRRPAQDILNRILQPDLLKLTGIVALLMLFPAHVLWYFERNNAESMIEHAAYIPGIFEALWWTVLALVGQAEDMPEGPVGKLVAVFWVFVGIIYLTYFTAGLTADLALQEIQGNIQTLSDLQNRPIALVADEGALEYLTDQNLRQITRFAQPEAAYAALKAQEVEAMIAPRPLLLYFAAAEPDDKFQLVGTPFLDQFYAIAMPEGSPYRTPINQAILTLRENGTYTEIHRKWFGVDP
jgi:polar amino acid transport system substrate-binding protein